MKRLRALPEHHSFFRRISRNPFLMPEGVDIQPDARPIEALRDRAWHAIEPHYLARLAGLVEMFGVARSKELGADDLAQVAASAVTGPVGTLLIEDDRHIPGHIDAGTGRIEFDDLAHPEVDDFLDDVGGAGPQESRSNCRSTHQADAYADGNCCHLSILS